MSRSLVPRDDGMLKGLRHVDVRRHLLNSCTKDGQIPPIVGMTFICWVCVRDCSGNTFVRYEQKIVTKSPTQRVTPYFEKPHFAVRLFKKYPKNYLPNFKPLGKVPVLPKASSIRINWLYLAILSVREAEPVLI